MTIMTTFEREVARQETRVILARKGLFFFFTSQHQTRFSLTWLAGVFKVIRQGKTDASRRIA